MVRSIDPSFPLSQRQMLSIIRIRGCWEAELSGALASIQGISRKASRILHSFHMMHSSGLDCMVSRELSFAAEGHSTSGRAMETTQSTICSSSADGGIAGSGLRSDRANPWHNLLLAVRKLGSSRRGTCHAILPRISPSSRFRRKLL